MSELLAPGYTLRRPEATDAAAVLALIVASDAAEFGDSEGSSLEEIESRWKLIDLQRDVWIVIDPHGALVGYGYVWNRRYVRLDVEVYVHPEHFNRGIGTTLLRLAEGRAREFVPLAPPHARVVVRNWINARNADARALLEREGYAPDRYFWRMDIDLGAEPTASVWPDGISVRTGASGEELRAFYETAEEAMADHWGNVGSTYEEWRERRTGAGFDPGLWFLAKAGDEPVGIALCSVVEGLGWVDTLAVRRPWRRRGVGSALLHHAFQEFHRREVPRVALTVDAANPTGATRLYEQSGMHVSQQYAAYGKELRPGEELGNIDEGEESGSSAVVEFDSALAASGYAASRPSHDEVTD